MKRGRAKFATVAAVVALLAVVAPAIAGAPSVEYPSFENAAGLKLNENASIPGDRLQLTDDVPGQTGSAFTTRKLVKTKGSVFSSAFTFEMTAASDAADGLTFVLHSGKATAIGKGGGRLGYGNIDDSVAVGFKTFFANTIEIYKDGSKTPLSSVNPGTALVGGPRSVWVDYNSFDKQLEVFFSDGTTKPSEPVLTQNVNLSKAVGGDKARVGFTAATGAASAKHEIIDLFLFQATP